jgi:hypothetical protein
LGRETPCWAPCPAAWTRVTSEPTSRNEPEQGGDNRRHAAPEILNFKWFNKVYNV